MILEILLLFRLFPEKPSMFEAILEEFLISEVFEVWNLSVVVYACPRPPSWLIITTLIIWLELGH